MNEKCSPASPAIARSQAAFLRRLGLLPTETQSGQYEVTRSVDQLVTERPASDREAEKPVKPLKAEPSGLVTERPQGLQDKKKLTLADFTITATRPSAPPPQGWWLYWCRRTPRHTSPISDAELGRMADEAADHE